MLRGHMARHGGKIIRDNYKDRNRSAQLRDWENCRDFNIFPLEHWSCGFVPATRFCEIEAIIRTVYVITGSFCEWQIIVLEFTFEKKNCN